MGYELYCGNKIGTVNLYTTVIDSFKKKNITPKKLGEWFYKDTKESLLYYARHTPKGEPILGQFFSYPNKPVRNTKKDIEKYCNNIKRKWIKWAKEKVDDCRLKGIKNESIHQIEFNVKQQRFTGKHRIMPPQSFIG